MTVAEIYEIIHQVAPFDTQAEDDNSGLLVGSSRNEVKGILFALDVSDAVIDEALSLGCNLIITHHPLMFRARQRLTDEDTEGRLLCRLIRGNLSLISAHTNLDQAAGGINDTLAALCGLTDVTGEAYFRTGLLDTPMSAAEYASFLGGRLHTVVRLMGPEDAVIRRVGLCSGSGGSESHRAAETGCDAFVTGEMKHHLALSLADQGIVCLECGHDATERPGLLVLCEALQNALNQVEYSVRVFESSVPAYAFPRSLKEEGDSLTEGGHYGTV